MNQISQQMSQGQIHITSCQVNIFSVKSKQRIFDQMENYLHWSILSGDKEGPGERGAVLQGGVRLFRLEQERHHSHQVDATQNDALLLIIKGTLVN